VGPVLRRLLPIAALAAGLAGCGDDDGGRDSARVPAGTTTQAEPPATTGATPTTPSEEEPPEEPRRERTPRSLAGCLRAAEGIGEVLVKGRESEDATFFSELAGGRVHVLGVTVEGKATEVTVALFDSAADARRAAPGSTGGGVEAEPLGSALVLAAPGAETAAVEGCLRETGYA
jgi:hypothetical protein